MKTWKRIVLLGLGEIAGLLLLHQVLLMYLAGHDVVSSILSAGSHVPKGILLLTGTFLVVRLMTVFLLPGMILGRIGLALRAACTSPVQNKSSVSPE